MINRHWPCWTAPSPSGTCSAETTPDTWPRRLVGQRFQTALARLRAASTDRRPVAVAAYTSQALAPPRWPAPCASCSAARATPNATLCSARRSELEPCHWRRGLRRPGAVRAAAGAGTPLAPVSIQPPGGPLRPGPHRGRAMEPLLLPATAATEIARVEVPDWLADDPELLALSHAMLVKQCELGLGYPVAISEAHEQAVITGHDREEFRRLTLMLLEQQRPAHSVSPPRPHPSVGPGSEPDRPVRPAHPHGGQVSAPAVSLTGGRDAGGSYHRMPGRSLIKRARRRWRVGPWLMFGIGSAIPWREPRMPLAARSATLPVLRGGSDCGKRIRPRQRHPPGRPCHPAIYGSA